MNVWGKCTEFVDLMGQHILHSHIRKQSFDFLATPYSSQNEVRLAIARTNAGRMISRLKDHRKSPVCVDEPVRREGNNVHFGLHGVHFLAAVRKRAYSLLVLDGESSRADYLL